MFENANILISREEDEIKRKLKKRGIKENMFKEHED